MVHLQQLSPALLALVALIRPSSASPVNLEKRCTPNQASVEILTDDNTDFVVSFLNLSCLGEDIR